MKPAEQLPDAVPAVPNPGSYDAHSMGCICPIADNNNGRTPPLPPDGWYLAAGCPVHLPHLVREVA